MSGILAVALTVGSVFLLGGGGYAVPQYNEFGNDGPPALGPRISEPYKAWLHRFNLYNIQTGWRHPVPYSNPASSSPPPQPAQPKPLIRWWRFNVMPGESIPSAQTAALGPYGRAAFMNTKGPIAVIIQMDRPSFIPRKRSPYWRCMNMPCDGNRRFSRCCRRRFRPLRNDFARQSQWTPLNEHVRYGTLRPRHAQRFWGRWPKPSRCIPTLANNWCRPSEPKPNAETWGEVVPVAAPPTLPPLDQRRIDPSRPWLRPSNNWGLGFGPEIQTTPKAQSASSDYQQNLILDPPHTLPGMSWEHRRTDENEVEGMPPAASFGMSGGRSPDPRRPWLTAANNWGAVWKPRADGSSAMAYDYAYASSSGSSRGSPPLFAAVDDSSPPKPIKIRPRNRRPVPVRVGASGKTYPLYTVNSLSPKFPAQPTVLTPADRREIRRKLPEQFD